VIRGEDPGEFEFYRRQMLGELAPAGTMESVLAERAVGLAWRLRRAERIQAEVFDTMLAKDTANPLKRFLPKAARANLDEPGETDLALGRVVMRDFANSRVLDRLGMYERRIEHSLYKTMGELQKLRLLRQIEPPIEEPTPEPVRPGREERLRQTNPISAVNHVNSQACGPAPRAHKGRSCLTKAPGLGIIPHSKGPVRRHWEVPALRIE